jgi:hypothetical protein
MFPSPPSYRVMNGVNNSLPYQQKIHQNQPIRLPLPSFTSVQKPQVNKQGIDQIQNTEYRISVSPQTGNFPLTKKSSSTSSNPPPPSLNQKKSSLVAK